MRVHKGNSVDCRPFYDTLQDVDKKPERHKLSVLSFPENKESQSMLEKYSHLFEILLSSERELSKIDNSELIARSLKDAVRKVIPVKDASLLIFNDSLNELSPVNKQDSKRISSAMNHLYHEGILNILFEGDKSVLVPDLTSLKLSENRLNYLLFPIYEDGKRKGVFAVLTAMGQSEIPEIDKSCIELMLRNCTSRLEKSLVKEKLRDTYEDLQTYQAKLSNDFRLSAIGELTEGVVEDIISPLQVIVSQVDMIDYPEEDVQSVKHIKTQVQKIRNSVTRLVKFANLNQQDIKIQPVILNDVINEYYGIVKSTLDSLSIECILDLEESIPPVLSHNNYIFQMLTNLIGLIKSSSKESGGIIIQTINRNSAVQVKIISTATLRAFQRGDAAADLNLRIVDNLMKKHEGTFEIESHAEMGSSILLEFPLRRRIFE